MYVPYAYQISNEQTLRDIFMDTNIFIAALRKVLLADMIGAKMSQDEAAYANCKLIKDWFCQANIDRVLDFGSKDQKAVDKERYESHLKYEKYQEAMRKDAAYWSGCDNGGGNSF